MLSFVRFPTQFLTVVLVFLCFFDLKLIIKSYQIYVMFFLPRSFHHALLKDECMFRPPRVGTFSNFNAPSNANLFYSRFHLAPTYCCLEIWCSDVPVCTGKKVMQFQELKFHGSYSIYIQNKQNMLHREPVFMLYEGLCWVQSS